MKRLFVLAALLALTGCAQFGNRLACTPGADKAYVVSEYGGRIGIATKIDERDMAAVCK